MCKVSIEKLLDIHTVNTCFNSLFLCACVGGVGEQVLVLFGAQVAWITVLVHEHEDVTLRRIERIPVD